MEKQQTGMDDRWVYFWSEYLIWSLRVCCYCSNLYFLAVIKGTFHTNSKFIIEISIGLYTWFGLKFSERLFKKIYRPRFFSEEEAAQLSYIDENTIILNPAEYQYRLLGEINIGNSVMFVLFNFAVALVIGNIVASPELGKLAFGAISGLISFVFTLFGIAGMVGEGPSGQRSCFGQILGAIFLTPPAFFVIYTLSQLIFM